MKRTSYELKALAREALRGHYASLIGASALLFIFTAILEGITQIFVRNSSRSISALILQFAVSVIIGVLTYLLQLGIIAMILHMARGQYFSIDELFYVFRHHPDRFIIVGLIEIAISTVIELPASICSVMAATRLSIGLLFLSVLLLLAGIILSFVILLGFALCEPLLIDNEDLGAMDSIRQSFALMHGNKGRYFYIQLSFLGLILLCLLSCGIGLLWLMPYMVTTEIFFYMDVCGELDRPHDTDDTSGYGYTTYSDKTEYTGYSSYDGSGSDPYRDNGSDATYHYGKSSDRDDYPADF